MRQKELFIGFAVAFIGCYALLREKESSGRSVSFGTVRYGTNKYGLPSVREMQAMSEDELSMKINEIKSFIERANLNENTYTAYKRFLIAAGMIQKKVPVEEKVNVIIEPEKVTV